MEHIEFEPSQAMESAKKILMMAAEAFKHRGKIRHLPSIRPAAVMAGFSVEQMKALFAKKNPDDPFQYLTDNIVNGRIRGVALFAGCKSTNRKDDSDVITIARELAKRDVLLMATGCNAIELAKAGFMALGSQSRKSTCLRKILL